MFTIDESLVSSTATYYKDNKIDHIITGTLGLTIPVRLTDKFAMNLDGTLVAHGDQKLGLSGGRTGDGGLIDATVFNATIGFTYSLGKGSKHSDWTDYKEEFGAVNNTEEIDALKQKIETLEANNNNNNNKGVDLATIQRMINERAGKDTQKQQDIAKELINNGYIASYFDYNVAKPTNESTEGIDFVLNYLRKNPTYQ
jgi:OOP family OmpA-OmpF porin